MSLPNGISFHPMAVAGCTQTDGTHAMPPNHSEALHCCNGDERFQWERPFYRVVINNDDGCDGCRYWRAQGPSLLVWSRG